MEEKKVSWGFSRSFSTSCTESAVFSRFYSETLTENQNSSQVMLASNSLGNSFRRCRGALAKY